MEMKKKHLIVILLTAITACTLALSPFVAYKLQTTHIGYLSGVQGLEATFDSVYWSGGYWGTSEKPPLASPSSLSFGYAMDFDPDAQDDDYPDLCATQQVVTVQTDTEPKKYAWQIKVDTGLTLANGTIVDVYKQFEMYRYRCDWAINLFLSGTESECHDSYTSAHLWLNLLPRPFVYFLGNPDQVFFAPAYVGLSEDVKWAGGDARIQDIVPKAKGEVLGVYYNRGGGPKNMSETKLLQYQEQLLDPDIFRSEYWLRIDLVQFAPSSWFVWWAHNWCYPSAWLHFLVYVFVVGEWTVFFKTGEVPSLNPHEPIYRTYDPLAFLSNPLFWVGTAFVGLFVLAILLIVFAGPAVTAFFQWVFRARKE